MATVMPRLEGVRLVVYSFHVDTAIAQSSAVSHWLLLAGCSRQTSSSVCYISVGSEPCRDDTHGEDSRCSQQIYDLPFDRVEGQLATYLFLYLTTRGA